MRGYLSKNDPAGWKKTRSAVLSNDEDGGVKCNCGWKYNHPRTKVQKKAMDRHVEKRHSGLVMWL